MMIFHAGSAGEKRLDELLVGRVHGGQPDLRQTAGPRIRAASLAVEVT